MQKKRPTGSTAYAAAGGALLFSRSSVQMVIVDDHRAELSM
jgi:NAD kinase